MIRNFFSVYGQRTILTILCLGFFSGLPLALTASTLGVWLTKAGVSKASIGLFAAISTPYALKFLWAPLIDGMRFPLLCNLLGRRRGWLVATQIGLIITIVALGFTNPAIDPWMTALMALMVAICSASQDIVFDAYRVELLEPPQYGAGAAAAVLGYRFGMIISSAVPLFLFESIGWQTTYTLMAMVMGLGIVIVLFSPEPLNVHHDLSPTKTSPTQWLRDHVVSPFADFMKREHWLTILLFILLYKLGDAFMGVMTNPFLIEIGFTGPQIATVVKVYGVLATIFGSIIGGWMVFRLGVVRTLWVCGILHTITNLMFVQQARIGPDIEFLALSISLENISGGMGTAAFVAFMSGLCNKRFTATQYALLSSFASFGRTWLSTPAGWFAERLGWEYFFVLSAVLAVPGLLVLWWLGKKLKD
jgi:MFS transporter, PAT family, beta-lactamase induction signal transducer AmpG